MKEHWPTHIGSSAFWEAHGRTVATFSRLEDAMFRAWVGLTRTQGFKDMAEAEEAYPRWRKDLLNAPTDALRARARKLEQAFKDDGRVDDAASGAFLTRLNGVRDWRNALCHGTWEGVRDDGSVTLHHWRRGDDGPELRETRLSVEDPSSIRAETVDLIACLMNILSAASVSFPGTTLPGAAIGSFPEGDEKAR